MIKKNIFLVYTISLLNVDMLTNKPTFIFLKKNMVYDYEEKIRCLVNTKYNSLY